MSTAPECYEFTNQWFDLNKGQDDLIQRLVPSRILEVGSLKVDLRATSLIKLLLIGILCSIVLILGKGVLSTSLVEAPRAI